jgi:hypothetical protein
MMWTIIACVLCSLVLVVAAHGRPSPLQSHLTLAIGPTKAWHDFSVTVHLKLGGDRGVEPGDMQFFLLGEDGNEVAQGVLNLGANPPQSVEVKDHQATVHWTLRWDPYVTPSNVTVGKRYQLVCTCKTEYGTIAGSAWFTLTADAK